MQDKITYGAKYGPAMSITSQADADAYFEQCVQHQMRIGGVQRSEAEAIERQNLGYWAGYYSLDIRRRVEKLFASKHPLFGGVDEAVFTPSEILEMGKRMAEK